MNRQVNAISGRLSLRLPQRRSLEILDRITEIVPHRKGIDLEAAIKAIQSEFPTVIDFEGEFPTGDNYEIGLGVRGSLLPDLDLGIHVNIFNISKINSEVRGGRSPRIKNTSARAISITWPGWRPGFRYRKRRKEYEKELIN